MEIAIEIPGVALGIIEAAEVRVSIAGAALVAEMDAVCERLRRELTVEQVAELPPVRGVRAMFRGWGVDPSRYRPSAEALLRRVVQGKGLYRVSNVVDINNLASIETGWPGGSYDAARILAPVALRLGRVGEKYQGIGKQVWHLEGKPVLADLQGPFGSPISDSTKTMLTEATTELLAVVYAPATSDVGAIERALERQGHLLERHAGALISAVSVLRL